MKKKIPKKEHKEHGRKWQNVTYSGKYFEYSHDMSNYFMLNFSFIEFLFIGISKSKMPQTTFIDDEPIKNTDKSLYLLSEKAKFCLLCGKAYNRMVPHIKSQHANTEVFVSRISPKMAAIVKQDGYNVFGAIQYWKRQSVLNLKTTCIFCEETKDFLSTYWEAHIRTHTGEYTNECFICEKITMSPTHCGRSTIKNGKCNLYGNGLLAFICIDCNFVQISKDNMLNHLRVQHEFTDFDHRYEAITVIPALNGLHISPNPSDILVQGKHTLMRVRKCSFRFANNYSVFL